MYKVMEGRIGDGIGERAVEHIEVGKEGLREMWKDEKWMVW